MAEIIVYVKDFRLGTRIAEVAAELEKEISFPENAGLPILKEVNEETKIVILDLDEENFEPLKLIEQIHSRYPTLCIVGFLTKVQKHLRDKAKDAGCTWVLPRSSFIKSFPALIEKGLIKPT